ncbi:retron Ec67 family RNA-directed DNA polymerase/endonuclease [Streptococcus sanguinis]|uniref:retron Ec67 family RNA-directed DNA polymerase/endonuclease n=2 Tax=Streptococcus sanguinis TaxID=1305 RepID=UPI003D0824C9
MDWNEIKSCRDFARYLNIPYKHLTYLLYNRKIDKLYESFEIPKKNGGIRIIQAPKKELKEVQQQILKILEKRALSLEKENKISFRLSHGFIKYKSIITNAEKHRNKKIILNIDIENFFPSFHFGRIVGFFEKNKNFKLPKEVAIFLAQLTTVDGSLPQGSPCSPIITNLICQILDFRISKLAKEYKLNYSRYVDDMTFSTNKENFLDCYPEFFSKLSNVLIKAGFSINDKKTRIHFNRNKQIVTGLVVNKKINVQKNFYKNTRAMAHNLYKQGTFFIDEKEGTINQLLGRFNFIDQLERYNNKNKKQLSLQKNYIEQQKYLTKGQQEIKGDFGYLGKLSSREKEYRKFLYYFHFFSSSKPVIVTEGKTDSRYLKAAMKKCFEDFPNLIQKNEDGTFLFKVKFLKRTSLLKYYFKFYEDGADSMKNLSNFWLTGEENKLFPNYNKFFQELTGRVASNPIIFLFDNELSNKKKPIRNFINHILKSSPNEADSLRNEISNVKYINIVDNLYMLTHNSLSGNEDDEIENLFSINVLNHKINGKSFSKENDYDSTKFYGKNDFSKYVLKNYRSIDFQNFIPLLNNLNKIILEYNSKLTF